MSNLYKLLSGVHSEGGKVFRKGDIFESKYDLTKHNIKSFSEKFRKLDPGEYKLATGEPTLSDSSLAVTDDIDTAASTTSVDSGYTREELEGLKVKELEGIAEELGYDTSDVSSSIRKRKQELINLIQNGYPEE